MTEWIKCSDKKPENGERILSYSKENGIYISIFNDDEEEGFYNTICINSWYAWYPTDWMQLPNPPKD